MGHITKIFLFFLIYSCLALNLASARQIPGIGTVYFAYDLGTYSSSIPLSSTNNWYVPGENFKTPVGLYHLNPALVDQQISNMRASGMDYVTLHIAFDDLSVCTSNGSCNNGYSDWLWGELVDDSQYALRSQQQQNLVSILQDIKKQGFRHVIVRFGNYGPSGWSAWQEDEYQKAWNLIVGVRSTVYAQLQGSVTTPIFDLNVEAVGDTRGQLPAYTQRLWSDYTFSFGNDDTVGFSMIGDTGHLSYMSSAYGSIKPKMYALDIYGDVGQGLLASAQAMGAEAAKPIIIMETYDNDVTTASQLQTTLSQNANLNVIALMQWQQGRAQPCQGCDTNISDAAVQQLNTTTQMSNYASIIAPMAVDESNPSLMHITDVNCAGTSASVCSVQGSLGFQPPSAALQNYQIYVTKADGGRVLWACSGGSPSTATASWMTRDVTYRFEYFQVSSCTASITGLQPAAVSYVWIR
ncbi:MAG TPA: hypothetical protein VIM98_13295 [Dyella sp.]